MDRRKRDNKRKRAKEMRANRRKERKKRAWGGQRKKGREQKVNNIVKVEREYYMKRVKGWKKGLKRAKRRGKE